MNDLFDKPLADPYRGVVLGVECAWPSREWRAADGHGVPAWDDGDTAQYTVSTGTPNR